MKPGYADLMECDERERHYEIYNYIWKALHSLHEEAGIGSFEISIAVAEVAVDICFESAPSPEYSIHLLLSSVIKKISAKLDGETCSNSSTATH